MAPALSPLPINLWPTSTVDPFANLTAPANEISTDEKYLRHEFFTFSGWLDPHRGWTPPEAREAIEAHLRGWPYQAASLSRHIRRFAYILGALIQRSAPPLRTQWTHEASRGPRYAVDDLIAIWESQFRPTYEEKIADMAVLGASVIHVHYVPDVRAGILRPRLKRWPHEAMFFRAASPAFPGGWYAITNDSGIVRMVSGDGHWIFLAHGERWHESAAILSLGELFVGGKLAERDEAGLSAGAGIAVPIGTLPPGVKINDPDPTHQEGSDFQKMVAGLGRARQGAVIPDLSKVEPFVIESDTQFFDRYNARLLLKCALSILGQSATLAPGANGVYQPIVSWSVADALSDKDHEATCRGWDTGLVRPFLDLNAINSDAHLVGERYADAGAKAKAIAERQTLHAATIQAMRAAGLDPSQEDVDALAGLMSARKIKLGAMPQGNGEATGTKPGGDDAEGEDAPEEPDGEPLKQALAGLDAAVSDHDALYERDPDGGPDDGEQPSIDERAHNLRVWAEREAGLYSPDQPRDKGKFASTGRSKAAAEARRRTKAARAASDGAKDAKGHGDAATLHEEAAKHHDEAAKRSRKAEHRASHEGVAAAHRQVAEEHRKLAETAPKEAPPAPAKKAKAAAKPAVQKAPKPVKDPTKLKADVEAKVKALPVEEHPYDDAARSDIAAGKAKSKEHIEKVLPKMSQDERSACLAFSHGHDYEMRALERGVSKDDLVKSSMAKNPGSGEGSARAHVERSARLLPHFHAAQDKLRTSEPPPPALYRGMSVSDRTLHELLTKKTFNMAKMSSSSSLDHTLADSFAGDHVGKTDYRGDKNAHRVVLQINKGKSAPILHPALSHVVGEDEHVLPRTGKYLVTKRTRSSDGTITVHLSEV